MKCDFHDSDKMPKHVEMVRTKCQPKSWDGQNANHRKKSGQNANLWLALCPVGILSSWHFVLPPFQPQWELLSKTHNVFLAAPSLMFPKRNRHPYPKSPDDRSHKVSCKCLEFLIDSVDVTLVYEDDLQLQRRIRWFWQLWVLKEEQSPIFWEDGLLRLSEKWKCCATDWPIITVRFVL